MTEEPMEHARFLWTPPADDRDGGTLEDMLPPPIRCLDVAVVNLDVARRAKEIFDAVCGYNDAPLPVADHTIKEDINFGLTSAREALKSAVESVGRNARYTAPTHTISLIGDLSTEVQAYLLALCMCDAEIVAPPEEGDQK